MVDPVRYCCKAEEFDKFLVSLRSNIDSHKQLFPIGGPDHVKYAISIIQSWNNHTDGSERHTKNTDPSEQASRLRHKKHPCFKDFKMFDDELMKMYGDKDRRLKSAMKAMQDYQQLSNGSVRVYANLMKANCRRAGWNQSTHDDVLHDIARSGLRHVLKKKLDHGFQRTQTVSWHWTNYSLSLQPPKPSRERKSPEFKCKTNSKGIRTKHVKAVVRNANSDHQSRSRYNHHTWLSKGR